MLVEFRFSNHQFVRFCALSLVIAAALNVLCYALLLGTTVVTEDEWRFLPLVQAFFEGHFNLASIWYSDNEHRTPVYLLAFLADAAIFRLNLRLELVVGNLLLVLTAILIARRFMKTAGHMPGTLAFYACPVALVALCLSLNQSATIAYPMDALAWQGGTLCFLTLWLALDVRGVDDWNIWSILLLTLWLVFILIGVGAGRGPALAASTIAILILKLLASDRSSRVGYLLLLSLLIVSVICEAIYWGTEPLVSRPTDVAGSLQSAIAHPGLTLQFVLLALATSAAPLRTLNAHMTGYADLWFGAFVLMVYVIAIWRYVYNKFWIKSFVPGFFILYSILFIISIYMARFSGHGGLNSAASPRYVLDTQIGFIGCLWIFLTPKVKEVEKKRDLSLWTQPVNLLVAALAIAGQATISLNTWSQAHYVARAKQAISQQQYEGVYTRPNWACGNPELCARGVAILKKYNLGIFRSNAYSNN